jgi:hypothetical protein
VHKLLAKHADHATGLITVAQILLKSVVIGQASAHRPRCIARSMGNFTVWPWTNRHG